MANPDFRQHLRVFFSADLVAGTAYKVRHPVRSAENDGSWPHRFREFFQKFPADFSNAVNAARAADRDLPVVLKPPHVWKVNGDEILFTDYVYPACVNGYRHLAISTRAFAELVKRYDQSLLTEGMGLRGTVWTAGFPIRNSVLNFHQGHEIRTISLREDTALDFEMGDFANGPTKLVDYIGPEMDLGFRIASMTPPRRCSCSLDVAWLLTHDIDQPLALFHVGWRRLKGVANGNPYPMLWLELNHDREARHEWDKTDELASDETHRFLAGDAECLHAEDLRALATKIWSQLEPHLMRPYVESGKEMAPTHFKAWIDNAVSSGITIEVDE